MNNGIYWSVDRHQELTPGVRTALAAAPYNHAAAPEHTWAALISIKNANSSGETCLVTFAFTFVLADALTGNLEAEIDALCRTRLLALRNAAPLASIVGIPHPL